jgi:hypothetical protein
MSAVETSAWARNTDDLEIYIEINLHVSFSRGFFFAVNVVNKSFCSISPFKALVMALESETVGMAKYDKLKERVRDLDLWRKL